jgi:hypothetical protein
MEVLNTISHTRVWVEPMDTPEKTEPLAKIKAAFILITRFPVQLHIVYLLRYYTGKAGNVQETF